MCLHCRDWNTRSPLYQPSYTGSISVITEQERQCAYKRNLKARSPNHSCRTEAVSITYSVCLSVALFMQHTMRMRRIILSSVACLALPYCLKTERFSEKGYWTQNVCLDFLYNFCLKTSHKSSPSSVPRGIVDSYSYSFLGHMGGGNNYGGYTRMGVATTHAG
jgi:hypothetical protein